MKLYDVLKGSYQRYIAKDFCATKFFNKRIPIIVYIFTNADLIAVKNRILDSYGDVYITAVLGCDEIRIKVSEIVCDNADEINCDNAGETKCSVDNIIIIDAIPLVECKRFDFSDLEQIMHRLRADDGCEWDRAQTHESIRINMIEEAYELVEAIDCKNADMIKEETGDILMQAVFHTEIAQTNGEFDYTDMISGLCRKLIDRHTHIFGNNHANNAEEALVFWNEAKKKEKKYKSNADAMDRVPKNLPALLYAEKIQKIAKKCGFDWDGVEGALDKVNEETEELLQADKEHKVEEAGDLLFAVVNVLRFFKIDPEMALHEANLKFYNRFSAVEREVLNSGRQMSDCTLEELDAIWNKVKEEEKKSKTTDN